ncbi:MAG: hypothetical protein ACK4NF_03670, partial [Planctomycetota bacterium]
GNSNYYTDLYKRIKEAVDKAALYVSKHFHKKQILRDPYILCLKQAPGCELFYRKHDIAMMMVYTIEEPEVVNHPYLRRIRKHSEKFCNKIYKKWSVSPVGNIAPESYASFAYYHLENKKMAEELQKAYKPEYKGWIHPRQYSGAWFWRKVYDESWPVMALARHNIDFDFLKPTIDNHIKFAKQILSGKSMGPKNDSAITATLFVELVKIYETGFYKKQMKKYFPLMKKLYYFLVKNDLKVFKKQGKGGGVALLFYLNYGKHFHYPKNEEMFFRIVEKFLDSQNADGSWYKQEEGDAYEKAGYHRKTGIVLGALGGMHLLVKFKNKILSKYLSDTSFHR